LRGLRRALSKAGIQRREAAMNRQPKTRRAAAQTLLSRRVNMSAIVVLAIAALAVVLAIGLAWLPMQLLVSHMARHVRAFIQRQRERRTVNRQTPDRRKA
jgi:hypothetical protein